MTDRPASGYGRILRVADMVARHGPLRLDAVMARTGLPRSATYRCLKELEAQGWIRALLSGEGYVVTHGQQARFGASRHSPPQVERAAEALAPLRRAARLEVDIAVLEPDGQVRVIESSRNDLATPAAEPVFASPLTWAGLIATAPDARLAFVRAGMARVPPDEQQDVTSGRFTRRISDAARQGHVWQPETQSLCLPLCPPAGCADPRPGAVRLEGSGSTRRSAHRLEKLVAALREDHPDLFPPAQQLRDRFWPALRRVRPAKRG